MKNDYWDDFCQSGDVMDYLKYVNAVGTERDSTKSCSDNNNQSYMMETMQYAGKSDGNGALGHAGW